MSEIKIGPTYCPYCRLMVSLPHDCDRKKLVYMSAKLDRIREAAKEVCDQGMSAIQVDKTGVPTFFLKDALENLQREIDA